MDKRHTEEERYIANRFNEYKEFIKDKHISFVIKKSERIVYGVYMLSRFIPTTDQLSLDLKKTSHLLLETTSQLVSDIGVTQSSMDQIHSHLQYMSSLFSLAFISGYISSSNIEIMKNEINYLHKHIEELSTHFVSERNQFNIKSDLFVVQQPKAVNPVKSNLPNVSFKENKKDESAGNVSFKKKDIKIEKLPKSNTDSESKDDREKRVIDVIRDKGVVSIKDISTVVFGVSEKTIQRTLQVLIDKGHIKKEGERRWAKYQLI